MNTVNKLLFQCLWRTILKNRLKYWQSALSIANTSNPNFLKTLDYQIVVMNRTGFWFKIINTEAHLNFGYSDNSQRE
jgi:hypothetical protein